MGIIAVVLFILGVCVGVIGGSLMFSR